MVNLDYIYVIEIVMLLMIHPVESVFQTKRDDVNLNFIGMMKRINESKTFTKDISCQCKCKFDGTKCNSDQKWNNHKCQYVYKNPRKQLCVRKRLYLESNYTYF